MLVERPVHAVLRQPEEERPGPPRIVFRVHERTVYGHVHAFHGGGEYAAGVDIILVAVAADAEPALVFGGLHHADAGGAGRMKDDVGAAPELAPGEFGALGGVAPRRRGGAGHVFKHLDARMHVLGAGAVAQRELADERNVHAANKSDPAGLRGQRGEHAAEKRRLLLAEVDRLDVWQVDGAVDDRELHGGKLLRDLFDGRGLREADRHNDRRTAPGELGHHLLTLCGVGDLELAEGDAGFLLETLRPPAGGLVERTVKLAAEIVNDGGQEIAGRGKWQEGQHRGQHGEPGRDRKGHWVHTGRPFGCS